MKQNSIITTAELDPYQVNNGNGNRNKKSGITLHRPGDIEHNPPVGYKIKSCVYALHKIIHVIRDYIITIITGVFRLKQKEKL